MKRTIPLWMGLLAFALLPALAQTTPSTPAPKGPMGKIHGHITNPSGAPQSGGTVTLEGLGEPPLAQDWPRRWKRRLSSWSMITATMQARLPPVYTLSYTAIRV